MEQFAEWGYLGLFVASFLAATVLPFSSEVVFSAVVLAGFDMWGCIWAATFGNFLGGVTCYYLGRLGKIEWIERYLEIERSKIERFQVWLSRSGSWTAFFSFLPFVGDVIAVALGFMRANVAISMIAMFVGKLTRYIVWIYGLNGVLSFFN